MADQNQINDLNNLNDGFTAMDLAVGAIEDLAKGLPLGTTSTGKYGILAAGFGIAEQLAIWENSAKTFQDLERFVIGISTNFPTPLALGLVPKKWFDDNFDRGQNEADILKSLLHFTKLIYPTAKSIDDPKIPLNFNSATRYTQPRRDPLTFDLDGDGLETVGTAAGILFDHDADGVKTGTGWVKADDALLVRDINGNGSIDNGRELFGDATMKSNGQLAADGFDALADLDSNLDGQITSADSAYSSLRLWRDLNQDGISQSGELFTLDDLGIASINVASTEHSKLLANGNQVADLGTYTKTDGTTGSTGEVSGDLGDINLATDTFHRSFTDTLDTTAVATLPDMQGSGAVRDLKQAASQSANDGEWRVVA